MNIYVPPLPSVVDTPPDICLCGLKTIEAHDFWFCSTECARFDAFQSLDNPTSHYRNAVRHAHFEAGVPMILDRRTRSAFEQRHFAHRFAPPMPAPMTNTPLGAGPTYPGCVPGVQNPGAPIPGDHPEPHPYPYPLFALDVVPVGYDSEEEFPMRHIRRVPSTENLKHSKPGLLDRFRKGKAPGEGAQRVAFGHPVDPTTGFSPPRKDARKLGRGV